MKTDTRVFRNMGFYFNLQDNPSKSSAQLHSWEHKQVWQEVAFTLTLQCVDKTQQLFHCLCERGQQRLQSSVTQVIESCYLDILSFLNCWIKHLGYQCFL